MAQVGFEYPAPIRIKVDLRQCDCRNVAEADYPSQEMQLGLGELLAGIGNEDDRVGDCNLIEHPNGVRLAAPTQTGRVGQGEVTG
jgi:hypothetical protein